MPNTIKLEGNTDNERIANAASDFRELLRELVPATTLDWRVEEVRLALLDLEKSCHKGEIYTKDRKQLAANMEAIKKKLTGGGC
ncbi:hypothetical protein SEA_BRUTONGASTER_137 [Gordonia phage BrutonGaster]|uniref:Uncharacterized protein n=1 Tax=Gordonia phage BrutonGaster TaxID=2530116 RepID=A0A482JHV6_9CAUD|nr:hypothetical protein HOV26_gp045 [Gordonia phage BrutonGaster]QBP33351.1 hypothetical protein SEA_BRUTONGASTER_137 [Gordonia phage BrutonGaster]